jgi:hypothetical protein
MQKSLPCYCTRRTTKITKRHSLLKTHGCGSRTQASKSKISTSRRAAVNSVEQLLLLRSETAFSALDWARKINAKPRRDTRAISPWPSARCSCSNDLCIRQGTRPPLDLPLEKERTRKRTDALGIKVQTCRPFARFARRVLLAASFFQTKATRKACGESERKRRRANRIVDLTSLRRPPHIRLRSAQAYLTTNTRVLYPNSLTCSRKQLSSLESNSLGCRACSISSS